MTSVASDEASDVASTASQEGQRVAGVAAEAARKVTDTAKDQAGAVVSEVAEQGQGLSEEALHQLERQAHVQSQRLADTLTNIGDEVVALAEGRPQDAANLSPYVSDLADTVYNAAERVYGLSSDIDEHGITVVLDDLQSFARRRPGVFLLGAAAAGFGIGRAVRARSADGSRSGSTEADPRRASERPARPRGTTVGRAATTGMARGR